MGDWSNVTDVTGFAEQLVEFLSLQMTIPAHRVQELALSSGSIIVNFNLAAPLTSSDVVDANTAASTLGSLVNDGTLSFGFMGSTYVGIPVCRDD